MSKRFIFLLFEKLEKKEKIEINEKIETKEK
jgi:hypothetical protein